MSCLLTKFILSKIVIVVSHKDEVVFLKSTPALRPNVIHVVYACKTQVRHRFSGGSMLNIKLSSKCIMIISMKL